MNTFEFAREYVAALDEASISRFVLYRVSPDTQTYLDLDPNLNRHILEAHPQMIFAKNTPQVIDSSDPDENISLDEILGDGTQMNQITTPRTISALSRWLNAHSDEQLFAMLTDTFKVRGAQVSTLQEVIESHVGATHFAMLVVNEIANPSAKSLEKLFTTLGYT
ncbi:hypothetical protein [Trueperella sp. LYQ143]|uniref:hypothetical protein n=1 Tax=Trueperella sp. LYQ143 TaxID=3391059 RepID=UPI003983D9F0